RIPRTATVDPSLRTTVSSRAGGALLIGSAQASSPALPPSKIRGNRRPEPRRGWREEDRIVMREDKSRAPRRWLGGVAARPPRPRRCEGGRGRRASSGRRDYCRDNVGLDHRDDADQGREDEAVAD